MYTIYIILYIKYIYSKIPLTPGRVFTEVLKTFLRKGYRRYCYSTSHRYDFLSFI